MRTIIILKNCFERQTHENHYISMFLILALNHKDNNRSFFRELKHTTNTFAYNHTSYEHLYISLGQTIIIEYKSKTFFEGKYRKHQSEIITISA